MKYLTADNQWTKSLDKERFTRTCLQRQSVSTDFRQPWDQGLAELHINMVYSYKMPQLGAFNRKLCVNVPVETDFTYWSWNVEGFNSFTDLLYWTLKRYFPSLAHTMLFMPLRFCCQTFFCSWLFRSLPIGRSQPLKLLFGSMLSVILHLELYS